MELKPWHDLLDGYLWHGRSFQEHELQDLSEDQALVVTAIRKSKNRERYRTNKKYKADQKHIRDITK